MTDNYKDNQSEPFDFTEQIRDAHTEYQLLEVCGQIGRYFGLPNFMIYNLPGDDEHKLAELNLTTNWPEFLIESYDKHELLQGSPLLKHLRTSTEPLEYEIGDISDGRDDGRGELAVKLFRDNDIERGVYFSVHLATGTLGAVNFSGSGDPLNHQQLVELNYLANLLYSKVHEIRSAEQEDFGLKKNEINCLKWTSQGKTSWEIASIMGLSEHTVNHYLTSAAQKLDTSNRTHAVSKALRLRIIS